MAVGACKGPQELLSVSQNGLLFAGKARIGVYEGDLVVVLVDETDVVRNIGS